MRAWLSRAALSVVATGVALAGAEAVLRARADDGYRVYPPGTETLFLPTPGTMVGIEGPGRFRVNRLGMRGDEPPAGEARRVLAVGGSTTECLFLDEPEAWPRRVQDALALDGPAFVGNIGRRGDDLLEHLLHLSRLLPQHPELDVVLVLAGVNDLSGRLAAGSDFRPVRFADWAPTGEDLVGAFAVLPARADPRLPPAQRLQLWQRAAALWRVEQAAPATVMDRGGENFVRWRQFRRDARAVLDTLPDLSGALAAYDANLDALAAMTAAAGVRLVLLTQPVLWRADLSPELDALLWMGGVGDFMAGPGHAYYTPGALKAGMDAYNDRTRAACARHGLLCVDLAATLPADTTTFFDDCHMNEPGARAVADAVAAALRGSAEEP